MKIAIHDRPDSFSTGWIAFCRENGIDYKIVNAYDSDIVYQISDCDVFMWHHNHGDYRDVLFAKQLLFALETAGKKVYPNFHTGWHFDDKVGEKYLLESIGAPLVPSYVFYSEEDAYRWIKNTTFPKVFKLRGGAGAANVKLARSAKEARHFVKKAFGSGFSQFDRIGYLKERYHKWRQGKDSFLGVCKGFGRLFFPTYFSKMHPSEKGYVYFQDFIENDYFDIRVIIDGDKAFTIKRTNSIYGSIATKESNVENNQLYEEAVRISFRAARELGSQRVGFVFVFANNKPQIVEMGFGFTAETNEEFEGYWTEDIVWHPERFNPQKQIVEFLTPDTDSISKYQGVYLTDYRKFDLRVVIVGDKLLAERRYCRKGDFRASGSGVFDYVSVDPDILELAFSIAEKLQLQTVAFDFLFCDNKPLIVEMSYAFGTKGLSKCPGYWTRDLVWHASSSINISEWILASLIH